MEVSIGVDVGGTNIKFGIFSEKGDLLIEKDIHTRINKDGSHLLEDILNILKALIKKVEFMNYELLGIGLGFPGPVQEDGYIEACVNLNLRNVNPAIIYSKHFQDMPIIINNDANNAALGELWVGGAMNYKSATLITLGTGVGGGIVIDNKIVNGYLGRGGEIGHTKVNPYEELRCKCGNKGCLDQVASATGIVRNTKDILLFTSGPSVLRGKKFTAKDVFDAAKNGDSLAILAIDYCMSFLGKSLANLTNTIDPEVFIIGGGVSKAGSILIDIIDRHYQKDLHLSNKGSDIVLGQLGDKAGIYGAAKSVFDYNFN